MPAAKLDIREHVLVPKHEILSEAAAKKVLERYRVVPHQLPLIKSSDPVAKAIGAKPGDILKITRESPTAGRTIAYRHVVEG
jgi:DNA-directed RNA polymerase subunit H